MNKKEDQLPVLAFGTAIDVQQSSKSSVKFKPMFKSKTLRVPIAGCCLGLSSSVLRILGFLVKS